MTIEELKKLDRRVQLIPYPFGVNYPLLRSLFTETAQKLNLSASDVIRQYADWKYSKK